MRRNNATSKEQDRTLIQKWEKQDEEASGTKIASVNVQYLVHIRSYLIATLDELRREHAKLQEAHTHDNNETEPGSTMSRHVSQAPQEENMAKQDMLMQQDVPMPLPTDIHSGMIPWFVQQYII